MPDLTLHFLQVSRSIRIPWLLEELGLDYKLETYDREDNGLAPTAFKLPAEWGWERCLSSRTESSRFRRAEQSPSM